MIYAKAQINKKKDSCDGLKHSSASMPPTATASDCLNDYGIKLYGTLPVPVKSEVDRAYLFSFLVVIVAKKIIVTRSGVAQNNSRYHN